MEPVCKSMYCNFRLEVWKLRNAYTGSARSANEGVVPGREHLLLQPPGGGGGLLRRAMGFRI